MLLIFGRQLNKKKIQKGCARHGVMLEAVYAPYLAQSYYIYNVYYPDLQTKAISRSPRQPRIHPFHGWHS